MNTANVMAVNTQPQGKAVRANTSSRTSTRSGNDGNASNKSDGFGNALDKARSQTQKDDGATLKEASDAMKDAAVAEVVKPQDSSTKQPQTEKNTVADEEMIAPVEEYSDEPIGDLPPLKELAEDGDFDVAKMMNATPVFAMPTEPTINLQSIMPQDTTASDKNKQMLAMLSGHALPMNDEQPTTSLLPTIDSEPTDLLGKMTAAMAKNVEPIATTTQQAQQMQPTLPATDMASVNDRDVMPNLSQQTGQSLTPQQLTLQQPATPMVSTNNLNTSDMPDATMLQTEGDMLFEQPFEQMRQQDARQPAFNTNRETNVPRDNVIATMTAALRPASERTNGNTATQIATPVNNEVSELLNGMRLSVEDAMLENMPQRDFDRGQNFFGQTNSQTAVSDTGRAENEFVRSLEFSPAENAVNTENTQPHQQPTNTANTAMPMQTTVGDAPSADAPANTTNVRDTFNIREQIVEQARLIRSTQNTEMVIRLRPEHLGELTLRVSVTGNGAVNASFHTPNAEVRAILENSLVQLRQELNNHGLKVEDVEVYAGLADGQLPNGQSGQAWQQGRNQENNAARNIAADIENFEEAATETTLSPDGTALTESVDYRV